jgi:hypothetical protein
MAGDCVSSTAPANADDPYLVRDDRDFFAVYQRVAGSVSVPFR